MALADTTSADAPHANNVQEYGVDDNVKTEKSVDDGFENPEDVSIGFFSDSDWRSFSPPPELEFSSRHTNDLSMWQFDSELEDSGLSDANDHDLQPDDDLEDQDEHDAGSFHTIAKNSKDCGQKKLKYLQERRDEKEKSRMSRSKGSLGDHLQRPRLSRNGSSRSLGSSSSASSSQGRRASRKMVVSRSPSAERTTVGTVKKISSTGKNARHSNEANAKRMSAAIPTVEEDHVFDESQIMMMLQACRSTSTVSNSARARQTNTLCVLRRSYSESNLKADKKKARRDNNCSRRVPSRTNSRGSYNSKRRNSRQSTLDGNENGTANSASEEEEEELKEMQERIRKRIVATDSRSPMEILHDILGSKGYSSKPFCTSKLVAYFVKGDESGYTNDLLTAVKNDDVETVKRLHESGHPVQCANRFGDSIIHIVARSGATGVLEYLINQPDLSVNVCCDMGRTPMHDACKTAYPNFDCIRLLLQESPTFLLMNDKHNCSPLEYIPKGDADLHQQWVVFLKDHEHLLKRTVEPSAF